MSALSWASGLEYVFAPKPVSPSIIAETWRTVELHVERDSAHTAYAGAVLVWTHANSPGPINEVVIGVTNNIAGLLYVDNVKVGTTRGGSDIFSDAFVSGDFSNWTSVTGSPSIVSDPFAAGHGNVVELDAGNGAHFVFPDLEDDVWATCDVAFLQESLDDWSLADNNTSTSIIGLLGAGSGSPPTPASPFDEVHIENIPDADFPPPTPVPGDWWP